MNHIPNFITSLNLASGFTAIILAVNGELLTAAWFILAAMIFDFLDGLSARLLKAYSAVGKELDSLADVVSFGVAPGVMIHKMLYDALTFNDPQIAILNVTDILLLYVVPAIMPVCAALRLAKFNLDSTQSTSFRGLPTPANALAVISLVIAGNASQSSLIIAINNSSIFLIIYSILLSLLMVTRIPLLSLKFSNLKVKGNEGRFILVITVLIAFAISGIAVVPLIIPIYILSSLATKLFR